TRPLQRSTPPAPSTGKGACWCARVFQVCRSGRAPAALAGSTIPVERFSITLPGGPIERDLDHPGGESSGGYTFVSPVSSDVGETGSSSLHAPARRTARRGGRDRGMSELVGARGAKQRSPLYH